MQNQVGSGCFAGCALVPSTQSSLPVVMRTTASHPLIRCVPHESFTASAHLVEPWATQLVTWMVAGKQPYFSMHAPGDTHAPENAYALHAMVAAAAAAAEPKFDVGELPAWPGSPRQLGLF